MPKTGKNRKRQNFMIPDREEPESVANTDPLGSYTGRTDDPYEVPVQDADDL